MIIYICNRIYDQYHKLWDLRDTRLSHMPFMSSPLPLAILVFGYLFMIRNGKKVMKNLQPLKQIDGIVSLYNFLQTSASLAAIFVILIYVFVVNTDFSVVCEPCKFDDDLAALFEAYLSYAYFLMKLSHFLDTVFFILRKKWSQITFLHVYHHVMIVIATYVGILYVPGGHSIGLGLLNCLENAIMYAYYFLSVCKPMGIVPSATMKKNVVRMQIAVFYAIAIHFGHVIVIPGHDCGYNKYICCLGAILSSSMIVLYTGFYWSAYNKKKEPGTIE